MKKAIFLFLRLNFKETVLCHCGRSVAETRNPLLAFGFQGMAGQARHDS